MDLLFRLETPRVKTKATEIPQLAKSERELTDLLLCCPASMSKNKQTIVKICCEWFDLHCAVYLLKYESREKRNPFMTSLLRIWDE